MKINQKQSGSALLIALLIMSFVGAIGFGLARISIFRTRLYTLSDASTGAFHAAESGLEFALLQYSLDKNAELSWEKQGGNTKSVVPAYSTTAAQNFTPVRYNLVNNQVTSGALAPSGNQEFDVIEFNHTYIIGEANCFTANVAAFTNCGSDEYPLGEIAEDDTTVINVDSSVNGNLTFYLRVKQAGSGLPIASLDSNRNRGVLVIDTYGASDNFLGQQVHYLLESSYYDQITGDSGKADGYLLNGIDGTARKLSITYYGPSTSDGGPLSFAFAAKKGNTYIPIESGLTTIDVVGRAGGSSRRMRAKIDRRYDRVIDIFDYAVYAQNSLSTPD